MTAEERIKLMLMLKYVMDITEPMYDVEINVSITHSDPIVQFDIVTSDDDDDAS